MIVDSKTLSTVKDALTNVTGDRGLFVLRKGVLAKSWIDSVVPLSDDVVLVSVSIPDLVEDGWSVLDDTPAFVCVFDFTTHDDLAKGIWYDQSRTLVARVSDYASDVVLSGVEMDCIEADTTDDEENNILVKHYSAGGIGYLLSESLLANGHNATHRRACSGKTRAPFKTCELRGMALDPTIGDMDTLGVLPLVLSSATEKTSFYCKKNPQSSTYEPDYYAMVGGKSKPARKLTRKPAKVSK